MTNKPKAIGTAAESAVVSYLRAHGWPHAERRALHGSEDQGDILAEQGLILEVKSCKKAVSRHQAEVWLNETDIEAVYAKADMKALVVKPAGKGPANVDKWDAWCARLLDGMGLDG